MTEFETEMLATMQAILRRVERLDENVNSVIVAQKTAQERMLQLSQTLRNGPKTY